jgi:hypothetical protein
MRLWRLWLTPSCLCVVDSATFSEQVAMTCQVSWVSEVCELHLWYCLYCLYCLYCGLVLAGKPPPGIYPSPDGADVAAPVSIIEWFLNFYDEARQSKVRHPLIELHALNLDRCCCSTSEKGS